MAPPLVPAGGKVRGATEQRDSVAARPSAGSATRARSRGLALIAGYSLPSIASEMIHIWISEVPSNILVSLASRQ